VDDQQLRSDGDDQLPESQIELICTDHETTDLERGDFRQVCDEDGLSESDTEPDDDRCAKPDTPVPCQNLGD
jgi:hypothetical protein